MKSNCPSCSNGSAVMSSRSSSDLAVRRLGPFRIGRDLEAGDVAAMLAGQGPGGLAAAAADLEAALAGDADAP